MPKARLDLRIDPDLLASIDAARGQVTRTGWIEDACRNRLVPVERPTVVIAPIIRGETEAVVAGAGGAPKQGGRYKSIYEPVSEGPAKMGPLTFTHTPAAGKKSYDPVPKKGSR